MIEFPARIRRVIVATGLVFAAIAAATSSPLADDPPLPSEAPVAPTAEIGRPDDSGAQLRPQAAAGRDDLGEAVGDEVQRQFNRLLREVLEDRIKITDWWLAATAGFLTMIGIAAVFFGYIGFRRFREIEVEARARVEASRTHAEEARTLVGEIQAKREEATSLLKRMTAKTVSTDPDAADKAVESVSKNPGEPTIDHVIVAAILLQQQGDFKGAIEKWRAIANFVEGFYPEIGAHAWFSVGYLCLEGGENDHLAAIDAYDRSIRLKPRFVEAYYNRGVSKGELGRHKEAIADYDEAIRWNPDHAAAYTNRGNAKSDLGQHKEAIADYDEAIQREPDEAEGYYNRGNAKKNLGQHKEAIADYDEAIRRNSDLAAAYINRGVAKSNLGRHAEAIADYDEVIQRNRRDAGAYYNRFMANAQLDRMDAAQRDLLAALAIDRDTGRDTGDEAWTECASRALDTLLAGNG